MVQYIAASPFQQRWWQVLGDELTINRQRQRQRERERKRERASSEHFCEIQAFKKQRVCSCVMVSGGERKMSAQGAHLLSVLVPAPSGCHVLQHCHSDLRRREGGIPRDGGVEGDGRQGWDTVIDSWLPSFFLAFSLSSPCVSSTTTHPKPPHSPATHSPFFPWHSS